MDSLCRGGPACLPAQSQILKMREVHRRLPAFRQGRAIEVEVHGKQRRLHGGDFQERGIGQPEPLERFAARGDLADDVYFPAFFYGGA